MNQNKKNRQMVTFFFFFFVFKWQLDSGRRSGRRKPALEMLER